MNATTIFRARKQATSDRDSSSYLLFLSVAGALIIDAAGDFAWLIDRLTGASLTIAKRLVAARHCATWTARLEESADIIGVDPVTGCR